MYLAIAGRDEAGEAIGGREPAAPRAIEPVKKHGAPSIGSTGNPNSRLGRKSSPDLQGRVIEQPATSPSFVGIDVSKDRLDVHVRPSGRTSAAARDGKGLEQLTNELRELTPVLIVLEATGGLWNNRGGCFGQRRPATRRGQSAPDFARATGRLAKTDSLDAQIIVLFAERIRPEPRPIADADSQALAELMARRRQVVEMIGMETNRASGRTLGLPTVVQRSWPRRNSAQ